ncbi:hypothetical protein PARC_a1962 [Pseudoalteromonas arctica A 37-1-2]|uniref:Uncharacterized protein n=1 Tax=Pseudoalteromonas arctica A 37-1-2 TaxID=1117313 RepID=A0A290S680_9GAMM|nr:hypothetical protein PARC_a1962 [Pseudoalteromonas arctica A 37-1-2]
MPFIMPLKASITLPNTSYSAIYCNLPLHLVFLSIKRVCGY